MLAAPSADLRVGVVLRQPGVPPETALPLLAHVFDATPRWLDKADTPPNHLPAKLPAIGLPQRHICMDRRGQKPQVKLRMDLRPT